MLAKDFSPQHHPSVAVSINRDHPFAQHFDEPELAIPLDCADPFLGEFAISPKYFLEEGGDALAFGRVGLAEKEAEGGEVRQVDRNYILQH